jgi:hypothetical protein
MKKKWMIVFLLSILTISACVPVANAPIVDYPATIAAMSVEATINAMEEIGMVATLSAYVNQLTPTCPVCPTPEPPTPTFTQSLPTATFTPVPTATNTPRPVGGISGRLSYPSEFIPPLRVIAFNTVTGEYYWQNAVLNQTTYRFNDLPVATYYVLAYLIENPSDILRAAYTQAVPCGLSVGCNDHNLIAVTVTQGQEVQNVDVTDWYLADPTAFGWPVDPTISR